MSVGSRYTAMLTQGELEAWGRRIGETAEPPLVLALRGELGAGKSVLARAIARGAGVDGPMPSPTFNLVFHYIGRAATDVYHLDLYRLDDPEEVWELGWQELGEGGEIVMVEWPERAEELLPTARWDIELAIPEPGSPVRRVEATRRGRAPAVPAPAAEAGSPAAPAAGAEPGASAGPERARNS